MSGGSPPEESPPLSTDHTWSYLPNGLIPAGGSLPPGIQRTAAAVEYNGRSFSGWQRQSHRPSVQGAVEEALSFVANQPVVVSCAGRTDAGVHGTSQIIHFDSAAVRSPRNWLQGANSRLPDGVRLRWVGPVAAAFHARFSALSRTYRYLICNDPLPPALFRGLVTWVREPLDAAAMHLAAQGLLGEHDFSAYRGAGCQSRSVHRNLQRIQVWRQDTLVIVEVQANAFLLHMVRNIVGALLAVGRGAKPPTWPGQLLALRDRTAGEPTAPPDGLYLVAVEYPDSLGIPVFPKGPLLVAAGP